MNSLMNASLPMVYTDPKQFESTYFDVWISFKDHGWSNQSMLGLPYMATKAIFDDGYGPTLKASFANGSDSNLPSSCMSVYVWSADMSFLISKPMAKC